MKIYFKNLQRSLKIWDLNFFRGIGKNQNTYYPIFSDFLVDLDPKEAKKRYKEMFLHDPNTGKLVCSVCANAGLHTNFSNTYTANRHFEGTHLNLRAYPCDYCGKKFKTKSQRTDHYSKVHKNQYQSSKFAAASAVMASINPVTPTITPTITEGNL